MKNLSNILSVLAFVGVCILGILYYLGGNTSAKKTRVISTTDASKTALPSGSNIAYVDLDTLEEHYILFKKKKAEFEATDKALGNELERIATGLQNEYVELQKKAQAGQITQEQGELASRKMQQRQQELEMKKQNEGSALIKKQEDFNKKLQDDIRGFLDEYAQEKGYDFVMAYSKTGSILFANPEMDITEDVIDALNSGKSFSKKDDKKEEKVEAKLADTVSKTK
jgi:outer membrane protein